MRAGAIMLGRVDRLSSFAPLSGLIAAVLFGAGSALWGFDQPPQDAGSEEIVSFYEETSTEILIAPNQTRNSKETTLIVPPSSASRSGRSTEALAERVSS
jgi:hypothetical protein